MSMARLVRAFALALVLLAAPSTVWAWGEDGHAIVAEIAQRRLTPTGAALVASLLPKGASLASVASWADDVRPDHPETRRWHYVGIPMGAATYDPLRDCPSRPEGDCIVAAIERARLDMHCAPEPAARTDALKLLVHLMGDLHQPMHAIAADHLGTRRKVVLNWSGQTCTHDCEAPPPTTNMHVLWDTTLVRKASLSWGGYVDRLEAGWLKEADAAAVATGTPADWASETHGVGLAMYALVPPDNVIDTTYYRAALPVLDQQLGKAGLRLAHEINAAVTCPKP